MLGHVSFLRALKLHLNFSRKFLNSLCRCDLFCRNLRVLRIYSIRFDWIRFTSMSGYLSSIVRVYLVCMPVRQLSRNPVFVLRPFGCSFVPSFSRSVRYFRPYVCIQYIYICEMDLDLQVYAWLENW